MSGSSSGFNGWLESRKIENRVDDALRGMDDGELYMQSTQSESLSFSDGRLRGSSFSMSEGFGLRAVCGERVCFAHSDEFSEDAIDRAASTVKIARNGGEGKWDVSPEREAQLIYTDENPIGAVSVDDKIRLLQSVDAFARGKDARVKQVSVSMQNAWSTFEVLRPGGERFSDTRPIVSFTVNVIMSENGRMESGTWAGGGRFGFERYLDEAVWQDFVIRALRHAEVNLQSKPAPAGKMTVVLGAGWPGVMLHEAVGHGLEGDAVVKGQSCYAGRMGEQVAATGVTIVDKGNIKDRRGSLTIDDEGTPTKENVLIENGILVGLMHDRLSARKMGVKPTGNGRRQSYAHEILPRMTNTFMLSGGHDPDEIIASVDDGIYAVSFGGGQVNTTSGDFVFACTEAYRVRKGRVEEPIKGATLIGNGPEAMRNVTMVGNNLELDNGIGKCGKAGQDIPVGVGQPTIRMEDITVGGTDPTRPLATIT